MPHLAGSVISRPNQLTYTASRGARYVLAMVPLIWIKMLAKERKVAVYCSYVAGAVDRVRLERLVTKLKVKKPHPIIIAFFTSWLRLRAARIDV